MTQTEALRLALEALQTKGEHHPRVYAAMTAIKAALEVKDEPWSPVSIGVDVTKEGAHVVGIYALDNDTSQIFYAKHHPAPQRTWVGLTDDEIFLISADCAASHQHTDIHFARAIEAKLKEKNTWPT
jgi:hypothetical protein